MQFVEIVRYGVVALGRYVLVSSSKCGGDDEVGYGE